MDAKDFDEKWNDAQKKTFEEFVKTEIGLDERGRPKCFGTGDDGGVCVMCTYRAAC